MSVCLWFPCWRFVLILQMSVNSLGLQLISVFFSYTNGWDCISKIMRHLFLRHLEEKNHAAPPSTFLCETVQIRLHPDKSTKINAWLPQKGLEFIDFDGLLSNLLPPLQCGLWANFPSAVAVPYLLFIPMHWFCHIHMPSSTEIRLWPRSNARLEST